MPKLSGLTVSIPASGVQEEGGTNYYEIQVTAPGEAPWRVLRRYRHFRALESEKIGSDVRLPPKLWSHSDPQVMEERRRGLERWLRGALAQATPMPAALQKFLLLGRCPLQAANLDAPSAPALGELELDEQCPVYLLEVSIPEGLGPDDLMKVQVPAAGCAEGQEVIAISIPWGLVPGQPLRLWWDPAANSLAVHARQDWQALRSG